MYHTYAFMSIMFDGRDLHTLLELFKYITENPEPSQLLLQSLKTNRPKQQKVMEGLVL
jgi:hypothetical protein